MGELRTMGREGDLKTVWDPEKPDEVAGAKAQFTAMLAKGYHAYAVKKNGDKGERITEFDPESAKIILAPQMRGGADGAHAGVGADRALKTILGGEPAPTEDEVMSDEAFAQYIREAPDDPHDYGDYARLIAKLGLAMAEAHPEIDWSHVPASDEAEYPDGVGDGSDWEERYKNRRIVREGFDTLWKRFDPLSYKLAVSEATGFQWGWGVNAVRKVLGLGPVANPAIIEV